MYRSPEKPSGIAKRLPSEIDLVLAVALAKDPADRFQSAAEFAAAFEAAAGDGLSAELRARAHTVVKTYPWGQPALWGSSSSGLR